MFNIKWEGGIPTGPPRPPTPGTRDPPHGPSAQLLRQHPHCPFAVPLPPRAQEIHRTGPPHNSCASIPALPAYRPRTAPFTPATPFPPRFPENYPPLA